MQCRVCGLGGQGGWCCVLHGVNGVGGGGGSCQDFWFFELGYSEMLNHVEFGQYHGGFGG